MKIITLLLGLLACQPGQLKTKDSVSDAGPPPEPSPITWTDCSSNEGDHPCDFTLKNTVGEEVNLYELYGKPVVVDFSTMWCYYCQMSAYDIREIVDAHEEDELVYITILVENFSGEPTESTDLVEWENHFGIGDESAPVLSGQSGMISQSPDDEGWYVEAWPTHYFIDRTMTTKMYLRGWSEASINAGISSIID